MKNFILSLSSILTILSISNSAIAEQQPIASIKDKRIKYIDYDARDIVKLYVTKGVMTQIEFAPDELVSSPQDAVWGESTLWIKWTKNNFYFIKPMEQAEYSNLFIQTNKRNYKFIIYVCKINCDAKVTYSLVFNYGMNKNKQDTEENQKENISNLLKTTRTAYKNYQYVSKGNQGIKPIDAYDNGKFIYLLFPNHKSMPVVYSLIDNKEVLTNSHIENKSTLVIHQLSKDLVLRLGNKVLAIRNQNYEKTAHDNLSSTISPLVERVINEK
jgi:type IV secretion system protein VirB9